MEDYQIKRLFNALLLKTKNPVHKQTAKAFSGSDFNYDEYQSAIEKYIKNIEATYVASEDLKSEIVENVLFINKLYDDNKLQENIKDFFSSAIYLISHNPEDYSEYYPNYLSEKIFDERYDKLISLLRFQDDGDSNLTLETKHKKTQFQLFKNKNNSLVIGGQKGIAGVSISKEQLKGILYNHKESHYPTYTEVILEKLIDNSIFDLINEKPASTKGTRATGTVLTGNEAKIEQLEQERLKTAGKISDLEDTLNSYKNNFDNLNSILEESKNVKQDFESAKESALKDISLQLSYKFWEEQSKRYNRRYGFYLAATIILSGILLWGIFNYLEDNPFGNNSITPTIKQSVPQVESDKAKLSTQKDGNKSSTNKQSLATAENTKPILSEKKDSNPSSSTKETDLDKMMKFLHYGFLILLSSMAIWFIRILMKITLSNYHLSIDANERVIMIRTYLSLIKEGSGYDENDKKVILDNIFRPTNHGIIKDESSVTVTDIISSFKK